MKTIDEHFKLQEICIELHNIRKEYDSNLTIYEKIELGKIEKKIGEVITSTNREESNHKDLVQYKHIDEDGQEWWTVEHKRVKGVIGTSKNLRRAYEDFHESFRKHIEEIRLTRPDYWDCIKRDVSEWAEMTKEDVVIHAINYEEGLLDTIDKDVLKIVDKVHLMPDTHIGKTVPIGFVADVKEGKIIPEMVGVDIGCGMSYVVFDKESVTFSKEDLITLCLIVERGIPTGFNQHEKNKFPAFYFYGRIGIDRDHEIFDVMDKKTLHNSVGTLGSGNHFIELVETEKDYRLVVHSGSRNFGATVSNFYQSKLKEPVFDKESYDLAVQRIKNEYKDTPELISVNIRALDKEDFMIDGERYLSGEDYKNYLEAQAAAVQYARLNRETILGIIIDDLYAHKIIDTFEYGYYDVPHNYYNPKTGRLYKGAVDASKDAPVIIPINMRDGIIFGKGKGNEDWMSAAPHGAGRVMSRTEARNKLTLEDMEEQTEGIYSTTIVEENLDEHPDAYRDIEEILETIEETVEIEAIGKPIFNFKG